MQATSVTELVGHNLALAADSAVVAYSAIVPQTSHGVPWLFNVTEWAANGGICHVHHPRCVCPARAWQNLLVVAHSVNSLYPR
jgi:hypothetical protein